MAKGKSQGIRSKNLVHKPMRQGAQKERVIPAGAAQLGQRQGNHITEQGRTRYGGVNLLSGTGFRSTLGNELAEKTKAGPGGSREVFKSGSMGTHGPVNPGSPMPKKELWPGWSK